MPKITARAVAELPDVFLTSGDQAPAIYRARQRGDIRKIGARLYTRLVTIPASEVIKQRRWQITALYAPEAVIGYRTAFESQPTAGGTIFASGAARKAVDLDGLRLRILPGPGPLEGDTPFIAGLTLASRTRAVLESLKPSRARHGGRPGERHSVPRNAIERYLDRLLETSGDDALTSVRDLARRIAPALDAARELAILEQIVSASRGAKTVTPSRAATGPRPAANALPPDADVLRSAWTRVGALFAVAPMREPVDLEELIGVTATVAREDQRLFVVPASWLAIHHHLVDARRLGRRIDAMRQPESATLGAMIALAASAAPGKTALTSALPHCRPLEPRGPLFPVMARSPGLLRLLQQDALPLFLQWGFWHDDGSLQPSAIRPVEWILEQCPELGFRLLVGPGLDAEALGNAAHGPVSIAELARRSDASYAAAHAAVQRLASRGLLAERAGGWGLGPTIVTALRRGRPQTAVRGAMKPMLSHRPHTQR